MRNYKNVLMYGAFALLGVPAMMACDSDSEVVEYQLATLPVDFGNLSPAGADYTISVKEMGEGKWVYEIVYDNPSVSGWITQKAKTAYDVTLTVAANAGFERKATVVIKDAEGIAESVEIPISQQETNNHVLTVAKDLVESTYKGGDFTVKVTSSVTVDWECVATDEEGQTIEWITPSQKGDVLNVNVAPNDGKSRKAVLLVSDKNKKGKAVQILVKQAQFRAEEDPIPADYTFMGTLTADQSLIGGDWEDVDRWMKKFGWEYTEHPNKAKTTDSGEHVDGKHMEVVYDEDLGEPVFRFMIHKNDEVIDGDRGELKDRQRNEMKSRVNSSDKARYKDVNGNYDDWQILEWKFKIPAGFQPSPSFTHIYQLKGHDGSNVSAPVMTLSLRANSDGSNKRVQVIHNGRGRDTHKGTIVDNVPMSDFEDEWVQVRTESHFCRHGYYAIKITRISDGKVLMDYAIDDIDMWRNKGTTNIRNKHGIYRNVGKNPFGSNMLLKDEELYLTDIKVYEKNSNPDPKAVDD